MIEIIKELNIEVSKPNVFQAVVAKQYDMNTRFIKATFVDDGDKIFIDPNATVSVVINALRTDGESKGFDGVVNEDGTVTVPLHSWMLELVGTVICDISVIDTATDDNKKLTTTSFTLIVEKAAFGGDDVTNDPQYDVLVSLLETCQNASEVAQEALEKSNAALEKSNEADSKYAACVEATENANQAAEDASAVRHEIETGGFIESLKEQNNGGKFTFWVGTQEQYDALETKPVNCFCIVTDEMTPADFIIEQGTTDDGWFYRKWFSGYAEANITLAVETTVDQDTGVVGLFCGANQSERIDYPKQISFVSKPQEFVTYHSAPNDLEGDFGEYATFMYVYKCNSETQTGSYSVMRPFAKIENATCFYYDIHLTGRWK